MDWNLKAPSTTTWDLAEMDHQTTLTNMETVVDDGSSSRYGVYNKGEFSVDLKLGHVGNSSSKDVTKMTSSSASGSSKRARAINNGIQTVLCLVDGCQADLSNCRDYHRRHKVCELHSKTAQVTIGGHKQRFCQQCSRFHSLEEFDEGKRSCRKRLDGHNRRRRKAQAEPVVTRSGSFLSNYQGTQLLPFSSSHMYPSTAMVNPSWGGGSIVTSSYPDIRLHSHSHNNNQHQQMHHLVDKQDLYLGTSPTNNYIKEVKNMSFIQQSDHHHNQSTTQATLSNLIPAETFRRNNPFSTNIDSACALSLLSSPQTHDPANGLNQQLVNHHRSSSSSSFMQPLGLSLHDHHHHHHSSLGSVDPVLGSSGSDHCSSMYDMGSSESQGNEAPPLYPFQWE